MRRLGVDDFSMFFNRPYGTDLYFITDGTYVKIGVAIKVYKRMAQLQTGNPKFLWILAHFPKMGYLESWCHSKVKHLHYNNE